MTRPANSLTEAVSDERAASTKVKVRASLGLLNLLIVLGALLFGGAGTLRYPQARLLLGLVRGDPVLAID